VRRQTPTSGINPAGSGRALRLDPLSLPVVFDAHDVRADGGLRRVELHRERVVLRRAVLGMRMAINVRVCDFRGVALRSVDDAEMLVLLHRDPSLTIPLCVSSDRDEIAAAWRTWSDLFALPQLLEDRYEPAARRRQKNWGSWRARACLRCSTWRAPIPRSLPGRRNTGMGFCAR